MATEVQKRKKILILKTVIKKKKTSVNLSIILLL